MRTTLNLDDDVLAAARQLARYEQRALGSIVSDLIRRGLAPTPEPAGRTGGFPTFEIEADAPPITDEMVARALDDL